ncbi:MAG: acyl-[acyl-carrier-protein]--UDP-N-acetylglucosamine O-acyltransferase [Betaproteobacteria bacterium]|nr:MAG: acyl-[acyl-carrier-protein]--UDP-N-acetylglucosamine O-acyltransferase [Betaproteobacteria bacterium]
MSNRIHPTATVDAGARLGEDIEIGPYAVIEADAEIGDGCTIAAHAVVKRHTRLGRGNRVYEHAVIGGEPQDLRFRACASFVTIGDGNVIREGVTIHRGSRAGGMTRIGDGCMLMATAHVAHDCELADGVIMANAAVLGGHVRVGERAFLSGLVGVHQFCRVGRLAMVASSARIVQNCLPFVITEGHPARARALNVVGLRRAGFDSAALLELKRAFRLLRSGLPLAEILAQMDAMPSPLAREMAEFIRGCARDPSPGLDPGSSPGRSPSTGSGRGFAHPIGRAARRAEPGE